MVMIARIVGILVAVVAVVMWFILMMMGRQLIVFLVGNIGVSGVAILAGCLVLWVINHGNVSFDLIWTVFTRSCS